MLSLSLEYACRPPERILRHNLGTQWMDVPATVAEDDEDLGIMIIWKPTLPPSLPFTKRLTAFCDSVRVSQLPRVQVYNACAVTSGQSIRNIHKLQSE